MSETCAICPPNPVTTATRDDDLPLCNGHWNAWLDRYIISGDLPPCAAHLIQNGDHHD